MVKFGKEFRKIQIESWKEKYMNYKTLKQFIKKNKSLSLQNKLNIENKVLVALKKDFTSVLDKELKRMYLFFVKNERELYVQINSHLYLRRQYNTYNKSSILIELSKLNEIGKITLNLTKFIIDNMTALKKILKKFDKNFLQLIGPISFEYLSNKLATNSDLLYIFRFKIVDEISALLDDLIQELKSFYDNSDDIDLNDDILEELKRSKSMMVPLMPINGDDDEALSIKNGKEFTAKDIKRSFNNTYGIISNSLKEIDKLIQRFKIDFKEWSKFLKLTAKKKGTDVASSEKENEEDIQKRRESLNMNISTVISFDFFEIITPSNENVITKENSRNIAITLLHTWLVCMCFTVTLPNNAIYFEQKDDGNLYLTVAIMLMTPLGNLLSLVYEINWIMSSYKKPLLLSCFFLLSGNFLYIIGYWLNTWIPMAVGRFLIGLGANRSANRSYLLDYIPKASIKKALLKYKILTIFGLCLGPLLVAPFTLFKGIIEFKFMGLKFDQSTFPSIICFIISIIVTFYVLISYTESINTEKQFIPYSNFEELDRKDNTNDNKDVNFQSRSSVNALNDRFQEVNVRSQFSDTNLVSSSIESIMKKEKEQANYLYKAFSVILILTLLCNFSTELILVYSAIELNRKPFDSLERFVSPIFFCILFAVLPFYLIYWYFFSLKISDQKFIIILLFFLPCTCSIIYIPYLQEFLYLIVFFIIIIDNSLLQDSVHHMFIKIIPYDYLIKGCQPDNFLKFTSEIGRIMGVATVFIGYIFKDQMYMRITVFSIIIGLFIIAALSVVIQRNNLREKPISRLLRGKAARKFRLTEF